DCDTFWTELEFELEELTSKVARKVGDLVGSGHWAAAIMATVVWHCVSVSAESSDPSRTYTCACLYDSAGAHLDEDEGRLQAFLCRLYRYMYIYIYIYL
ncbi:LOW QUALITY PROTEIN: hypothetical protein PanWU01x14_184670, partial [Parasponia andersonii]